jgi:amidohydrolase
MRERLRGEVQLVFQPAEEAIGGAKVMLDEGVLQEKHPDACLALHIWNLLPAGSVGVREGPLFAATDQFTIRVLGRGGHGAMPHQTVDPVPVSAQVITALQSIVSRETSPFESAVVTIGTINGGTAYNIIPSAVEMRGTARSFRRETQFRLKERIESVVRGVTGAARAGYEFEYSMPCPAVVNDTQVAAFVRRVAIEVLGQEQVVVPEQTMGGDDMSFFLQQVPGCYFFVGGAPRGGEVPRHHSATFDFDERALTVGAEVLAAAAVEFLNEGFEAGA